MKKLLQKLSVAYWTTGFVEKGIAGLFEDDWHENVKWVNNPNMDDFADPFILDVTENEIHVLVEDIPRGKQKGVISLLKIDRKNMEVLSRKVIIDIPTHLSFPSIWRQNGKVFICPESALSGRFDIYEYHQDIETATFYMTVCDEVVWDSCISDKFGDCMLFTSANDDYHLDIFKWDNSKNRFVPWKQISSDNRNMRMGGQLFEYKGNVYYPAQDCNGAYGGAIQIKKLEYIDGVFTADTVKTITSPHPIMNLGLHTVNECNGVVVIDVHGYRYPIVGRIIGVMVGIKKKLFRNRYGRRIQKA